MELVSTTSVAATAAALSSNVATGIDSVWTIVVLAVSIPLAFYILHRVIALFPGRGGRR